LQFNPAFAPLVAQLRSSSHEACPHRAVLYSAGTEAEQAQLAPHINSPREGNMPGLILWLLLLLLCWPLALLALILYPLVWLLLLPLRLIGIGVDAVFELLRAIVMLPARVLRGRRR